MQREKSNSGRGLQPGVAHTGPISLLRLNGGGSVR